MDRRDERSQGRVSIFRRATYERHRAAGHVETPESAGGCQAPVGRSERQDCNTRSGSHRRTPAKGVRARLDLHSTRRYWSCSGERQHELSGDYFSGSIRTSAFLKNPSQRQRRSSLRELFAKESPWWVHGARLRRLWAESNLGVDGRRLGFLRVRRDDFPMLVHEGLIGVLVEDVVEDNLAVLLNLLVRGPLRISGAQVGGFGVHLHLLASGSAPDLGVDEPVVRDPLPEKEVAVRVVLELHVQRVAPGVSEPDRGVHTGPDVRKLRGVRVALHDLEPRVVGGHVQRRSDLAQTPAVGFFLLAVDDDASLVVVQRGDDLVHREDLSWGHYLPAYGVRGDPKVFYPLGACIGAQGVVGPVSAQHLRGLELLGFLRGELCLVGDHRHLVLALSVKEPGLDVV